MNRALLATLITVVILVCPAIDVAFQNSSQIAVAVEIPDSTSVGIPIVGAYVINNNSKVPLRVDVGQGSRASGLRFDLTKPDGTKELMQTPDPGPPEGIHQGGRFEVAPGERIRVPFVLDQWLRFDQPGRYTLVLRLEGAFTASDPSVPINVDRSAVRRITVLPRDPEAIRRRCKELLDILRRPNISATSEAAMELSYFPDSAAIPFMVEAIDGMPNPGRVIDGIVRIDGIAAREALTRLSQSPKADIAAAAKQGLTRLKKGPRVQARRPRLSSLLLFSLAVPRALG